MTDQLPISVVPGSNPPKFQWRQVVSTGNGKQIIEHEGCLPPTVEGALVSLIGLSRQLMMDNAGLRGQVDGLSDRVAKQSEQLSRTDRADVPPVQVSPVKKGKG